MSGIIGSKFNHRGSGLIGSLGTDGQHMLSSGAGKKNVFETVTIPAATDLTPVRQDILTLALKQAVEENHTKYNLANSAICKFEADADFNLAGSTDVARNASEYIEAVAAGGFTVVKDGSPTHSTTQSTSWSTSSMSLTNTNRIYCDQGSLIGGPYNFGTSGATLEMMFYTQGSTATTWDKFMEVNSGAFASEANHFGSFYSHTSTDAYYYRASFGGVAQVDMNYTYTNDAWHHVAVVFAGGTGSQTYDLYQDGSRTKTNTYTFNSDGADDEVRYCFPNKDCPQVWVDNFRFSNTARYSGASYTAPTDHFTSDANTLCLIQSKDQGNGTSVFTDESTVTSAVSATGTALGTTNVPTSAVTDVSGVMLLKDAYGSTTLGTDVKAYFTADNSNWTEATSYADAGTFSTGIKMIKLGKATCTEGSDVRWKIVWANQVDSSKEAQIYGIGINY